MNLLIIGAGGLGQVVKEIAENTGYYSEISFVDDSSELAIGTIEDLGQLRMKYDTAFVAIGNNEVRKRLQVKISECGYIVPTIISDEAYVSKRAVIGEGVLIQPKAVINTNSRIEDGVVVSIGALIDHDTEVGAYTHINTGAIIKAGARVDSMIRVDAGEVVRGFY